MSLRPYCLSVTLFTQTLHNLHIMQLSSGRNQADEAMQVPKYLIAVFFTVNLVALRLYTSLSCKLVCISLFREPCLSQVYGAHTYGGTFPDAASRPVPCSDFSHFLLPSRILGDGKWEEVCRKEVFFSVRKESGKKEGKNGKRNSEKSANEK